jgi:ribose transport system permease protein
MQVSGPGAASLRADRWRARRTQLVSLSRVENLLLLAAYVGVVAYFSVSLPFFLTSSNFLEIINFNAGLAVMAVGFALVLVGGGIDLSIGSNLSVGMVTMGECSTHGLPTWACFALGICVCGMVGFVNGAVITWLKINPLIATLAMLFVLQGVAAFITGGLPLEISSASFLAFELHRPLGIGLPTYALVAVAVPSTLLLTRTRFGRHLHAIGGNPAAARQVAMNVDRLRRRLYILSGLYVGIAAVIMSSFSGEILPTSGMGFEFSVATVVLLGGVSLSGGRGSIIGALLGTMFIATLSNGLVQLSVNPEYVPIIGGTLLILAVGFDQLGRGGFR